MTTETANQLLSPQQTADTLGNMLISFKKVFEIPEVKFNIAIGMLDGMANGTITQGSDLLGIIVATAKCNINKPTNEKFLDLVADAATQGLFTTGQSLEPKRALNAAERYRGGMSASTTSR